ncbi:MAG: MFS transporter [Firmicutes bacterium]|nr:MFS transporter [Bacillota bacterium]
MKEKLATKNFILVCATNLLVFLYPYLLITTFPFYIKSLGGSEMTVGLVAAVFSVAGMLARPFAGFVSDHYSRRFLLLAGLALLIGVSLGYAFLPYLAAVVLLRLLHGVLNGCVSTSLTTVACDTVPQSRFAEGMGFFGMMTAFPMAAAPALGFWLMNSYGFRPMFLVCAGLTAGALACALGLRYRRLPRGGRQKISLSAFFDKNALPAGLIIFLAFLPFAGVSSFVALYAQSKGLGGTGLYFVLWACSSVGVRFIFGRYSDRHGENLPIILGNACFVLGLLLLVCARSPLLFDISGLIYGAGFGVLTPAVQTMSVRAASPERRGAASCTYLIMIDLSGAVGSALAGFLVTALGYQAMFLLVSLFAAASVLYYRRRGRFTVSAFKAGGQA